MIRSQANQLDEELLLPIPQEYFERLLEGSKLSDKMRAAVASVLVPKLNENGLPTLAEDGSLPLLGIAEAAAAHGLTVTNVSRAVRDVQKKWLRYHVENNLVPAFGAVSPAYFIGLRAYQNEIMAAKPAKRKKRTKAT